MRLEGYMGNESRSKTIDPHDAITEIQKNCQQAVSAYMKGHKLYRGVRIFEQALMVDPKKHVRRSANTENSYTLIIDNSPKWKSYPKRSQSIICSSSIKGAAPYGNLFCVFPVDGSNYGICPSNDIWGSFTRSNITDLNDMNNDIFFRLPKMFGPSHELSFNSLSGLKSALKSIDEHLTDFNFDDYRHSLPFMKTYNGSLWDMLSKLIVPNGFKQTKKPQDIPMEGVSKEIWTDGKSYMINEMWLREKSEMLVKP